MRTLAFSTLVLLCASATAQAQEATCADFDHARLSRSVVQLVFMYDEPKPDGSIGQRGTAWFIDETHLITIGHLAKDVIGTDWQTVTVQYSDQYLTATNTELTIPMRLVTTFETIAPENITLIELQHGMLGFEPLQVRYEPPKKDEPVVGAGYTDGILRAAAGWYRVPEPTSGVMAEPPPDIQGYLLFELNGEDGRDRHVFDYGASGSPILDCDGRVVAVTSDIITQLRSFGVTTMRITPSTGQPNNTALPASLIVLD